MTDTAIEISTHPTIAGIGQSDWDACACPEDGRPIDPFTTYRFLHALEVSGSVGPNTGWQPRYLRAIKDGQVIAVAPLYVKGHSQGEYIFDHNWAQAYEKSGGRYYPKLQMAVPFTPVTGRRFLTRAGFDAVGMSALIKGTVQIATENQVSSIHATFCTEAEALAGEKLGLMPRIGQQFHWVNNNFANFDEFLATLASRKRKNIKRERRSAQGFGGKILMLTGDAIAPEHWDAFWAFYQDTGERKWGTPYLTRAFFDIAHNTLRDDILLVLAISDGRPVAGALNFIGRDTLYGRYWGCTEHHDCLHFELCYYTAIDFAIEQGLARVEAGAQGEHKLARGYLPCSTHSLHWFGDLGFREAVGRYLVEERNAIDHEIEVLTNYGPFRKSNSKEQP